jgi:hypothetical protein
MCFARLRKQSGFSVRDPEVRQACGGRRRVGAQGIQTLSANATNGQCFSRSADL